MAEMMGKSDRFSGGYYRNNAFQTAGESEGSGSSGRIDTEVTASEDLSALNRKCINLNSDKQNVFCVPMQILSPPERKDPLKRLIIEFEQILIVLKKVEFQRTNGVTVSSSSDTLSCSNGQNWPQVKKFRKSSVMRGPGKKMNPVSNEGHDYNRGSTDKTESAKMQPLIASTTNILLMKQCETLLKRLMSHQYGWVFNTPVDVVKLNIPDYFTFIKHPMDLGTIKGKIASGAYSSPLEFLADVRLTFRNAMTYNPPWNDVHVMADTLCKFFEARWKAIEKKLPVSEPQLLPGKKGPHVYVETVKAMPTAKKRKIETLHHEFVSEPVKPIMTAVEKQNPGKELESLLGEMSMHITDFLREHSSSGRETGVDEIKIDIDDHHDDTWFTLRKLLDDFLKEKKKNQDRAEPCEIELFNESGLSNSSIQQCKEDYPADEDIDIGGNEPHVSSYPPVEIEKATGIKSRKCVGSDISSDSDSSSSSDSESGGVKASSPITVSKVPEALSSGAQLDEKTSTGNPFDGNQSASELVQVERTSRQKLSSIESDCCQDVLPVRGRSFDSLLKSFIKLLY